MDRCSKLEYQLTRDRNQILRLVDAKAIHHRLRLRDDSWAARCLAIRTSLDLPIRIADQVFSPTQQSIS